MWHLQCITYYKESRDDLKYMWWCVPVTCERWAVLHGYLNILGFWYLRESWNKSPWILRENLITYLIVACGNCGFGWLAWNYSHFAPLLRIHVCRLLRMERNVCSELHGIPHHPLWVGSKVKLHEMADRGWEDGERPSDVVLGIENIYPDIWRMLTYICVWKFLRPSQVKISPGKRHVRTSHWILSFQTSEPALFL